MISLASSSSILRDTVPCCIASLLPLSLFSFYFFFLNVPANLWSICYNCLHMPSLAWLLASFISWPQDMVYLCWSIFVSCRISPYTRFPICDGLLQTLSSSCSVKVSFLVFYAVMWHGSCKEPSVSCLHQTEQHPKCNPGVGVRVGWEGCLFFLFCLFVILPITL